MKLERLFEQSNYLLYNNIAVYDRSIKEYILARANLTQSSCVTDTNNTEFDRLIATLSYCLESSDDEHALAILGKVNSTLTALADSFESVLDILIKASKN